MNILVTGGLGLIGQDRIPILVLTNCDKDVILCVQ